MANSIITIDQKLKRVRVGSFELDNEIVFTYLDKLPADKRDEALHKAIYIGVLALMEDRLSAFLSKTQNELGTELESLKMIFEMKKEVFFKTAVKGMVAENDIAEFLNNYFAEKKLKDKAETTGTMPGKLPKNKTGDIVCFVDGEENKKIVIEVKFDKSLKLGTIEDKEIFTKKQDTAWSQILEARVNREGKAGIIVFDISMVDGSILKFTDNVGFVNGIGFVAIVDSQKGDYTNLIVAYNLARDIVLNAVQPDFDDKILSIILKRIIRDINTFFEIKKLVQGNIESNMEILKHLEKSFLLMEFNQKYLSKFLKDGKLTEADLLTFYSGDEVKEKFVSIEKEILSLAQGKQ
jgi:hypothetical protein